MFANVTYVRPRLGPPLSALRYVMYFRFVDDVVFTHSVPCGVSVDRASDEHRAMAIGSTSAYGARPVFVLGFLSCGSGNDCDCRLQTQ